MKDISMDIDSKFIKKLNDLNQECKMIFTSYYMFPNGVISANNNQYKSLKGIHYAVSNYRLIDGMTDVIKLNAMDIYTTIKNNKKDIKKLIIRDNAVILSGTEEYPIGNIISITALGIKELCRLSILNRKFIDNFKGMSRLSEEDIRDLVKNYVQSIQCGTSSTIISKELIPGLKKSHDVDISYVDSENKELYNLYMMSTRDVITCIHQYKCIRW